MSYLGDSPKFSTFPSQRFSGDGSTTAFVLQQSTPSPASIIVTIDGVKQQAATYGVTGTSLEFSPGVPASGSNNIEVIFMGLTASGIPTVDQTLGVNAIMRTIALALYVFPLFAQDLKTKPIPGEQIVNHLGYSLSSSCAIISFLLTFDIFNLPEINSSINLILAPISFN